MFKGSSSSSSSENNQTTNQTDERVAASDDAIVIQLDDNAVFELTDPGLIEAAGAALEQFSSVFEKSLGFAKDSADRSLSFAETALGETRSDESKGLRELLVAGAVVAVVALAAPQLPKIFGKG